MTIPRPGGFHQSSHSRVLFGDEPWLVLLAVIVGGFVFHPLVRDDWPWLMVVLLLAAQARWSDPSDREAP